MQFASIRQWFWQYALIFFSNNTFIVSIDYFCFKYDFYLIGIDKPDGMVDDTSMPDMLFGQGQY